MIYASELLACRAFRKKRKYDLKNPRQAIYPGHRERDKEQKRLARINPPTEQVCIGCGELKPIEQYRKQRSHAKSPRVKTCLICEGAKDERGAKGLRWALSAQSRLSAVVRLVLLTTKR